MCSFSNFPIYLSIQRDYQNVNEMLWNAATLPIKQNTDRECAFVLRGIRVLLYNTDMNN